MAFDRERYEQQRKAYYAKRMKEIDEKNQKKAKRSQKAVTQQAKKAEKKVNTGFFQKIRKVTDAPSTQKLIKGLDNWQKKKATEFKSGTAKDPFSWAAPKQTKAKSPSNSHGKDRIIKKTVIIEREAASTDNKDYSKDVSKYWF